MPFCWTALKPEVKKNVLLIILLLSILFAKIFYISYVLNTDKKLFLDKNKCPFSDVFVCDHVGSYVGLIVMCIIDCITLCVIIYCALDMIYNNDQSKMNDFWIGLSVYDWIIMTGYIVMIIDISINGLHKILTTMNIKILYILILLQFIFSIFQLIGTGIYKLNNYIYERHNASTNKSIQVL